MYFSWLSSVKSWINNQNNIYSLRTVPSLLAFQSDDPSLNPVNVYPTSAHRCSLEGAFTIFLSLEAFFWGVSLKRNHYFHIFQWSSLFGCEKTSVADNKNHVFLYKTTARLFSISSSQVGIKPFVRAGQACAIWTGEPLPMPHEKL